MTGAGWDVIVLGAGAAGLMAAIHAAERGRRTLLLEKNRKPGVKILMSGGTRCNITQNCDNRGIVAAYGPPGKFLHSPLAAFSVQDTVAFFESEGVPTKVEETGKIFPVSDKALDVLDALLRRLRRSGAVLALGEPATDLRKAGDHFEVTTPQRLLSAAKVIITTGGQSYPGSGTRGDGYPFAARFGHTIITPKPALVPLTVQADWVAELRGVTLTDVTWPCWITASNSWPDAVGFCSLTSASPGRRRWTSARPLAGIPTRTHWNWNWISYHRGPRSSSRSCFAASR